MTCEPEHPLHWKWIMNKDLLNQIPADEQRIASTLYSMGEDMKVSPNFEWELETQLIDAAITRTQPVEGWHTKILAPMGWVLFAICSVYMLNWIVRSLPPEQPTAGSASSPEISFESNVRAGNICKGTLAASHNFSVSLTNQNKTGFVTLDEHETIGELRSFSWSPNGQQLAIVGNTTGQGNIYLTDSASNILQPVLSNSEVGYMMGVTWSQNGDRLIAWGLQNKATVYLFNKDGTGFTALDLPVEIFETPQFAPGNESILFYGADSSFDGLFQAMVNGSQLRMISNLVEDEASFAWSPDGSRLAYMEMDRNLGEARLVLEEFDKGGKVVIASLPIPKGSGSSIPSSANLIWSPDGKALVFEFGRGITDRAIYLAYADGTGLVKLADSAHAPAISADGNCLAYISNKQVFLMDLTSTPLSSTTAPSMLLANLPVGRSIAAFQLDKLAWGSGTNPAPRQP